MELSGMESVLIAFSGGVDSSLVLKLAYDALQERAVAALALSASLPQREQEDAVKVARQIGAPLLTVDTDGGGRSPIRRQCSQPLLSLQVITFTEH